MINTTDIYQMYKILRKYGRKKRTLNAVVVERDGGDLRLQPLKLPHFVAVLLLQRVELLRHVRGLPSFGRRRIEFLS